MLASCARCGRVHERGACPRPRPRYASRHAGEAGALRSTAAWQRTREAVRELDGGMCVACRAQGLVSIEGLSVHHVVPIAQDAGLALDEGNLVTLCAKHHRQAEAGRISPDELREMMRRFRRSG